MPTIVKSFISVALSCVSCLTLLTGSVPQSQKTSCGAQETNTQTTTPPSPEFLAVKDSLEKHGVALIGEAHDDPKARDFIKDNLCALGINTLYVEVLTTDVQEEIDNFDVDRNTKEDMRVLVMRSIGYENPRNDFSKITKDEKAKITKAKITKAKITKAKITNYTDLFWTAKQLGITIVPLEDPDAKKNLKLQEEKIGESKSLEWRLITTNALWASRIKEHMVRHPKARSIVLAGAAHQRLSDGIPGIGDNLKIPGIEISNNPMNWGACTTLIPPNHQAIQSFISSDTNPEELKKFDFYLKKWINGNHHKDDLDAFEKTLSQLDTPGLKSEYQQDVQERVDVVCTLQALQALKSKSH
jgi:uncharacterized iron-regulated protein